MRLKSGWKYRKRILRKRKLSIILSTITFFLFLRVIFHKSNLLTGKDQKGQIMKRNKKRLIPKGDKKPVDFKVLGD